MKTEVTKITLIRNLGVFRDFTWPSDLPEFRRYNLIYGWNWSGKTLLSRIFAALQTGSPPQGGEIKIVLSGGEEFGGEDFGRRGAHLGVRVFNRDFIDNNVYGTQGVIGPIYVLGEKRREQQQELEEVNKEIRGKIAEREAKKKQREKTEKDIDKLCTDGAKEVRDILRMPGRMYERREFRDAADKIFAEDTKEYVLDADEHNRLLLMVTAERKPRIDIVIFSFKSSERFFEQARVLCETSVISTLIDNLKRHPDVNTWVEHGMKLHQQHGAQTCLFCDQTLPKERLRALEEHFSAEYSRLANQIDQLVISVRAAQNQAERLSLPVEGLFYPDLKDKYIEKHRAFEEERSKYTEELGQLVEALEEKRRNPFPNYGDRVLAFRVQDSAVTQLNEVISKHNTRVDHHDQEVNEARRKLEVHIIAEKISDYRALRNELQWLDTNFSQLEQKLKEAENRKAELERSLVDHLRPAEDLNNDLASYLGHSELKFEVHETGYMIVRDSRLAESLSEGEKTAIAFLYFLKSLEDKDFDIDGGIVVVDDPVSSLDSNALFHAFGFMKSRVMNAAQLFVLTHNFLFFRQVRNWFSYLPKKERKNVRYYMLEVIRDGAQRNSRLKKLDPLLENYESEYHYLFSLIYRASQAESSGAALAQYHYLPNVARRLLEAFLAFRVPGKESIYTRMEKIDFDPAKKTRILRFCDTHSHCKIIDEIEQEPVILGEGCAIANDFMDLIKKVDPGHFEQMVLLIDQQAQSGES